MVKTFEAVQFWSLSHELMRIEQSLPPAVTKNWSPEVRMALTFALNQCKTAGLGDAAILPLCSVGAEMERFDLTLDYETDVRTQLKVARKAIEVELGKRKFVYITENHVRYLEQDQLFGTEAYDAFPAARLDLKEAGSALACGLKTAAGFHLMRTAEVGLWELGRDRRIPLAQKDSVNSCRTEDRNTLSEK